MLWPVATVAQHYEPIDAVSAATLFAECRAIPPSPFEGEWAGTKSFPQPGGETALVDLIAMKGIHLESNEALAPGKFVGILVERSRTVGVPDFNLDKGDTTCVWVGLQGGTNQYHAWFINRHSMVRSKDFVDITFHERVPNLYDAADWVTSPNELNLVARLERRLKGWKPPPAVRGEVQKFWVSCSGGGCCKFFGRI